MSRIDWDVWTPHLPEGLRLETGPVEDHLADLPLAEQALVVTAVKSRREEFSSARFLAHRLLAEEGEPEQPILCATDRSPLWPKGWLGSLTHGRRSCAAAVARKGEGIGGVGIDLEELRPVREDLFAEILSEEELKRFTRAGSEHEVVSHVLACFSIKEAVYKAMFPLGNAGLGFDAMEVLHFHADGRVTIRAQAPLEERLQGCALPQVLHLRQNDVLLSLAWLGSDAAAR